MSGKSPPVREETKVFKGWLSHRRAGEEQMKLGGSRDTGVGARSGRGMRGKAGKLDTKDQGPSAFHVVITILLNDSDGPSHALGSSLCQEPL